jgi:hypothetical protein
VRAQAGQQQLQVPRPPPQQLEVGQHKRVGQHQRLQVRCQLRLLQARLRQQQRLLRHHQHRCSHLL